MEDEYPHRQYAVDQAMGVAIAGPIDPEAQRRQEELEARRGWLGEPP